MAGKAFKAVLHSLDASAGVLVPLYENGGIGGNTIAVGDDDEIRVSGVHIQAAGDMNPMVLFSKSPGLIVDEIGVTAVAGAGAGFSEFTRAAGSFVTDGFTVGESVVSSGFTNGANNGTWAISSVAETVLTVIDAADAMVDEVGDAGNILTPKAYSDDWRMIARFSGSVGALFYHANFAVPVVGPKGHSIYLKSNNTANIDVMLLGHILQR